jgi:Bacterial PH domain
MSFGPPLWRPFALLAAALVAGGLGFLVPELWAPAAVLLAAAVRDLVSRPALVITAEGFHYVVGLGRAFASWDLVEAVRVREERHFLAFGRNLEIDLSDETLVVLSKLQLAASPDEVAELVETGWHAAIRH